MTAVGATSTSSEGGLGPGRGQLRSAIARALPTDPPLDCGSQGPVRRTAHRRAAVDVIRVRPDARVGGRPTMRSPEGARRCWWEPWNQRRVAAGADGRGPSKKRRPRQARSAALDPEEPDSAERRHDTTRRHWTRRWWVLGSRAMSREAVLDLCGASAWQRERLRGHSVALARHCLPLPEQSFV